MVVPLAVALASTFAFGSAVVSMQLMLMHVWFEQWLPSSGFAFQDWLLECSPLIGCVTMAKCLG